MFVSLRKINEKNLRKYKYLQMTVLYTKYKAENNALWTIYVNYGLKIYRKVWKFESGKSMEFWNGKCVGTLPG